MERAEAVIFTRIFTSFHLTRKLVSIVLHFSFSMQKINKLVAGASDGGKKETKEIERICCYFYNFICFISLYALVSSLFVFHFTCLMQKIKKLVAGGP